MSTVSTAFLNQIGRFSILYTIAAPIYIFVTEEYKNQDGTIDAPKLAIAILILCVIASTIIYWKNPKKHGIWQIIDRGIATSILALAFAYGNNNSKVFAGASAYFYLLGNSGNWQNYNSFINHIVFRFFGGLAILMYIIEKPLWNGIFVLFNFLVILGLLYMNLKNVRHGRTYNRGEEIRESILIF